MSKGHQETFSVTFLQSSDISEKRVKAKILFEISGKNLLSNH